MLFIVATAGGAPSRLDREYLQALKESGFATAILSNGSPDMLAGAVENAGIGFRAGLRFFDTLVQAQAGIRRR